jgi:hypothetical protein
VELFQCSDGQPEKNRHHFCNVVLQLVAQTAGSSAASLLYFLAELDEFSNPGKRLER